MNTPQPSPEKDSGLSIESEIELYTCLKCYEIPVSPPIYYCLFDHAYCAACYNKILVHGGAYCPKCFYVGTFTENLTVSVEKLTMLRNSQSVTRYTDQLVAQNRCLKTLIAEFDTVAAKFYEGVAQPPPSLLGSTFNAPTPVIDDMDSTAADIDSTAADIDSTWAIKVPSLSESDMVIDENRLKELEFNPATIKDELEIHEHPLDDFVFDDTAIKSEVTPDTDSVIKTESLFDDDDLVIDEHRLDDFEFDNFSAIKEELVIKEELAIKEEPGTNEIAVEEPTIEEPATNEAAIDEPTTCRPASCPPAMLTPVMRTRGMHTRGMRKPVMRTPVMDKSADGRPVVHSVWTRIDRTPVIRPVKCPNTDCQFRVESLCGHFELKHKHVPRFQLVRGEQEILQLNMLAIEPNTQTCLAVLVMSETLLRVSMIKPMKKKVHTPPGPYFTRRELPIIPAEPCFLFKNTVMLMMSRKDSEDGETSTLDFWFCTKQVDQVPYLSGTLQLAGPYIRTPTVLCRATFSNQHDIFEPSDMVLSIDRSEVQNYMHFNSKVIFHVKF